MQRNFIEIRNSKKSNLGYAALGFTIILVVFIKSFSDKSVDIYSLIIFILFFGSISGYFINKAYDKNPIYIIDDKKVFIRKNNLSFYFKDLSFYRYERLGSRYAKFDCIFFYNSKNSMMFKINVSNTDYSVEEIMKKLNKHLKEKKYTVNMMLKKQKP